MKRLPEVHFSSDLTVRFMSDLLNVSTRPSISSLTFWQCVAVSKWKCKSNEITELSSMLCQTEWKNSTIILLIPQNVYEWNCVEVDRCATFWEYGYFLWGLTEENKSWTKTNSFEEEPTKLDLSIFYTFIVTLTWRKKVPSLSFFFGQSTVYTVFAELCEKEFSKNHE